MEQLGAWLRANNLDYPWCWNFALRQLDRWDCQPEMAQNRVPHLPYATAEPTTGSEILHFTPSHVSEAPEAVVATGASEIRWGGGPSARYLPPELQFRLAVPEGWAVHLGEDWNDAKARIQASFKECLKAYKSHVLNVTSGWQEYDAEHFELLVRRVVPPVESLKDISGFPPPRQPREASLALAKFIGIKVIGKRPGRPRNSAQD